MLVSCAIAVFFYIFHFRLPEQPGVQRKYLRQSRVAYDDDVQGIVGYIAVTVNGAYLDNTIIFIALALAPDWEKWFSRIFRSFDANFLSVRDS